MLLNLQRVVLLEVYTPAGPLFILYIHALLSVTHTNLASPPYAYSFHFTHCSYCCQPPRLQSECFLATVGFPAGALVHLHLRCGNN